LEAKRLAAPGASKKDMVAGRLAQPVANKKGLEAERLVALGARWLTAQAPPVAVAAAAAAPMCPQ
jgi:hypothetical protein